MPSANGVYTLPTGYLAVTGQTILASQHNPPLEDIAAALTLRVSRDGTAPMTGPLKTADGVVGAPAIAFNSGQTTGFYKTANGNIGVAIAGTETVEFGPGGIVTGARHVGEIFDWTLSAAPPLCVLPFGQTLSRTGYPALWAFAQIEIAAGNTLYNNGDGSLTFGILDMRGRVRATKDNMGGSAASRLTTAGSGVDGSTLGTAGGGQNQTLTLAQLPTGITSNNPAQTIGVFPDGSGAELVPHAPSAGGAVQVNNAGTGASWVATYGTNSWAFSTNFSGVNNITVASNNTGGVAHPIVPPVVVTNCALFAGA
jgi:microcystin-dependent protein